MSEPNPILAALARRIAAAGAEREAAHRDNFTTEGFYRWVALARRYSRLRLAISCVMEDRPFHDVAGSYGETIFLPALGWRPGFNPA